jgi:hypothetical protein
MKNIIAELLEDTRRGGDAIDDASDIPADLRGEIIRAWLDTANDIDLDEAMLSGSNTPDECRTLALFACGMKSEMAAIYLQKRFWEGIAWLVDAAIMEVRAEHELTALIAREERAEQQAEWQRERYADTKEYQS